MSVGPGRCIRTLRRRDAPSGCPRTVRGPAGPLAKLALFAQSAGRLAWPAPVAPLPLPRPPEPPRGVPLPPCPRPRLGHHRSGFRAASAARRGGQLVGAGGSRARFGLLRGPRVGSRPLRGPLACARRTPSRPLGPPLRGPASGPAPLGHMPSRAVRPAGRALRGSGFRPAGCRIRSRKVQFSAVRGTQRLRLRGARKVS